MNAPYANFAVAQRVFDRTIPDFASEADRQERIGQLSEQEEARIYACLLTDDELAQKISDDIPGYMDTETITQMVRAALSGDAAKVRELLMVELDGAVKREAESIALDAVEA
jgi:hypothetical protein